MQNDTFVIIIAQFPLKCKAKEVEKRRGRRHSETSGSLRPFCDYVSSAIHCFQTAAASPTVAF